MSTRRKQLAALLAVALFLAADFAISYGGHSPGEDDARVPEAHLNEPLRLEPPTFERSKTFPRLGSIALNLTPCLHHTGKDLLKGFVCDHDLYSAYVQGHSNGDHWGNAAAQFAEWFASRYETLKPEGSPDYEGINSGEDLKRAMLRAHGVSENAVKEICLPKKEKPLANATDLPENLTQLPLGLQILASSMCRHVPFFEGASWWNHDLWDWGQADYEEEAKHLLDHDPVEGALGGGADALGGAHSHGAHHGPHGLDFNTETNWVYTALSHQGKVAIVNLNVVDWGKVADYEERTGYRVLLFDEEAVWKPEAVLYYASRLLNENRGREAEFARHLDAVHNYCFREQAKHLAPEGQRRWEDDLRAPSRDPALADALWFFRNHTSAPLAPTPPPTSTSGWACFLAFTGIDARKWTDPELTNPFCTFDTRHLARYDRVHSPGLYSRANPNRVGAGDAWRCDWFVRYIEVTSDIEIRVRRGVDAAALNNLPVVKDQHVSVEDAELPNLEAGLALTEEWVEVPINVTIGPHDVAYSPANGLVYVTHYWQFDDPDVRMLPDWTIHAIDGNPGSPAFHNPYLTRRGAPSLSLNGHADGSATMVGEPFPIDVGGPIDGLHPTTVDVDPRNGAVFVVNRESNTLSLLLHDGNRNFTSSRAQAILSGPMRFAVGLDLENLPSEPRDFTLYRDPDGTEWPSGPQIGGGFSLAAAAGRDRCEDLAPQTSDPNLTLAEDLCRMGLLNQTGLHDEDIRARGRALAEGLLRDLVLEETPFEDLLADLGGVLSVPAHAFAPAANGFRERWLPVLTDPDDVRFFDGNLRALETLAPGERGRFAQEFLAHAEARWPGRTDEFLREVLTMGVRLDELGRSPSDDLVGRWSASGQDGTLLGFEGSGSDDERLRLIVTAVEPTNGFLRVNPTMPVPNWARWVTYCVSFSLDDWLLRLSEGRHPWGDGEQDPWHCDDVPPFSTLPTPIQTDYAGKSNHHHVFIIREPIGPLLMDYNYELRPRLLQPFDVWINPGDSNIYVSNLGNHDNAPLVRGWISLIKPDANIMCHTIQSSGLMSNVVPPVKLDGKDLTTIKLTPPKISCKLPPPSGSFQADHLIGMGYKPHHLNVNPYTFEVYGGHLEDRFILAAQREGGRAHWTIPKAVIGGADLDPRLGALPMGAPTGMGVNPSTQRLFVTHFADRAGYTPNTGGVEPLTRYTSVVDLRNYSLTQDLIYGGDHHAVVDQVRPPGRGVYEEPFYNRTTTLVIGGKPVMGSMGATADSSGSLSIFWRCTYYRLELNATKEWIVEPTALANGVRKPLRLLNDTLANLSDAADPFVFTSGRCFNMWDLNEDNLMGLVDGTEQWVAEQGNLRAYRGPETLVTNATTGLPEVASRVFWETGEEEIHYGFLNLFFDPDNVPPTLRVRSPAGRDTDRLVQPTLQASEELVSSWMEVDTKERVPVPQGEITFELPDPEAGLARGAYNLTFNTSWSVEWNGPLATRTRPVFSLDLWKAVNGTLNKTPLGEVTWDLLSGSSWRTVRLSLAEAARQGGGQLALSYASPDPFQHETGAFVVGDVRIRDALGERRLDLSDLSALGLDGDAVPILVESPDNPSRVQPAIAFTTPADRPASAEGDAVSGALAFNLTVLDRDPEIVLLIKPATLAQGRGLRAGQPYDKMQVDVSVDAGLTWRNVWTRDSRDPPHPDVAGQSVNLTLLTSYLTGEWRDANPGAGDPSGGLLVRFRFDALDPSYNQFEGWLVEDVALLHNGTEKVPLRVREALPDAPGPAPRWWDATLRTPDERRPAGVTSGHAFRFQNERGDYATLEGAGGGGGFACPLGHRIYGIWNGPALFRGPGTGALTFCARDLAGHVTELTFHDGRGLALVEDTFRWPGFTENYWERQEIDPAGLGFPAYVFDPLMDGMGDLIPKDTPVELDDRALDVVLNPGPGELLRGKRGFLFEAPPIESNVFATHSLFNSEATALTGDGIERRRAFLVTGSDPDLERLPAGLRKVVEQEQGYLNASHLALLRPPSPVADTLAAVSDAVKSSSQNLLGQGGHMMDRRGEIDLDEILATYKQALAMLAQLGQYHGKRTHQDLDTYVLDGTPSAPQVAGERLSHAFRFSRDATEVTGLDLSFDVVARHRYEDYVVEAGPRLGLPDTSLLDWLLHNVTMDRLNLTEQQFNALVPNAHLVGFAWNDTKWLANTTLHKAGTTLDALRKLAETGLGTLGGLLSFSVPESEILNGLATLQMNLPTYGAGFSVRVKLVDPDGNETLLAVRDGIRGDQRVDFTPLSPRGEARVTLAPAGTPGAYEVRLGMDMGRFEKIRVHLEAEDAARLLHKSGTYRAVIETFVRSGDAPAPGLFHEVAYGGFLLSAATRSLGNEAPDPSFAWHGPVVPGAQVTFWPGRSTASLANLEDQDGHVRHYNWTITNAGGAFDLRFGRAPLRLDDNASALNDTDLRWNGAAAALGRVARHLTVTRWGPDQSLLSITYDADGCIVPAPSMRFNDTGVHEVTLTVRDDQGAAAAMTQQLRVAAGEARRAPEFVVDPIDEGDGKSRLVWQRNNGSLFLESSGAVVNLTRFIPDFNATELPSLTNVSNLTLRLDLSEAVDLTLDQVRNAVRDGDALVNKTLSDPLSLLDVLLDWLLLRPGTVRVVTQEPEDASAGARMQILLGETPMARAQELPILAGVLQKELGQLLPQNVTRLAREAARTSIDLDPDDPCRAVAINGQAPNLCDPDLEDLRKLLLSGAADAWIFRFALHPSVDGKADLNTTLAQVVAMDTGAGYAYFVLLDVVEDADRIAEGIGQGVQNLTAFDPAELDPIVPVTPWLRLADAMANATADLAGVVPAVVALHSVTQSPTSLLQSPTDLQGTVARAAGALALTSTDVQRKIDGVQELRLMLDEALANATAHLERLDQATREQVAREEAEARLWALNAFTDVTLGPLADQRARILFEASADSAAAQASLAEAADAARAAIDEMEATLNLTKQWSYNWTDALASGDPRAILRRVNGTLDNATALAERMHGRVEDFHDRVVDPLKDLLEGLLDHGEVLASPGNQSITLGYDASTGRVHVRIGDAIVKEGALQGPRPEKVHVSMSLTSVTPHRVEVQAMWGGRGARLIDGFNRDGGLDPARFHVETGGRAGPETRAVARVVDDNLSDGPHQLLWVSRSVETGLTYPEQDPLQRLLDTVLAAVGLDKKPLGYSFVNRHRFLSDGRASPPGTTAAEWVDTLVPTFAALKPAAELGHADAQARLEGPFGYTGVVENLTGGVLHEFRVAHGAAQRRSAYGLGILEGPPAAPFVFDVRGHRRDGDEGLQVAFQPAGRAWPPVTAYEVYAAPRPPFLGDDVSDKHLLGTVDATTLPQVPDHVNESGWRPGVQYQWLNVSQPPAALADDWRYVVVRAVNARGPGPFSEPFLLPPVLLQERFALHRAGPLWAAEGMRVDKESGVIDVHPNRYVRLRADTCLGDKVDVTRVTNYPQDEIAADWARSLRIQERGIDTLFSIVRQLNQSLGEVPLNLSPIEKPLVNVSLDLCHGLRGLIASINNVSTDDLEAQLAAQNVTTILQALKANPALSDPLPHGDDPVLNGLLDLRLIDAWSNLSRRLVGNQTLNLSIEELLHGVPATVQWQTDNVTGPYYARVRFQFPGLLHLPDLSLDTSLDGILPVTQVGLLHALIPGERFHLLQLGHVNATGNFSEVLRVDFDPHMLAPLDIPAALGTAQSLADGADPVSILAGDNLPLSFGISAGDTPTHRERIGKAKLDTWHTIEVYAPDASSGHYTVALDGKWAGMLRTSSRLPPNALRIGGSNLPTDVFIDDVRFANAIHPPAPLARVMPLAETHDFATVQWHVPEHGGAPLTDFNLLRIDLDAADLADGAPDAEVVATAAAGSVRSLIDPDSHDPPVGKRYAYAVQALNGLPADRRNAGPASDARAIVLPGFYRVSEDASVVHDHGGARYDKVRQDGRAGLAVGGVHQAHRAVFQVNASEMTDGLGRALDRARLGSATFFAYAMDTQGPFQQMGDSDQRPPVDPIIRRMSGLPFLYGDGLPGSDCLDLVGAALSALFAKCTPAVPEAISFTGMCEDVSRDLEMLQVPFNCWEDGVAAYVSPSSAFDAAATGWSAQPRTDYWHQATGLDRQTTRSEAWRRYELLPSLLRDDDGDVAVTLKKENERALSASVAYAASEDATWLDDIVGHHGRGPRTPRPAWPDGAGPTGFPWTDDAASTGERAIRLGGRSGFHSVVLSPQTDPIVPMDAPIKMHVFIPEGSSPRQIGMLLRGDVYERSLSRAGARCEGAYGAIDQGVLVTWGEEIVSLGSAYNVTTLSLPGLGTLPVIFATNQTRQLLVDGVEGIGHAGDLLAPLERMSGHHAGGVPTQRGRWVTLTFDAGQAIREHSAKEEAAAGVFAAVSNLLAGLSPRSHAPMPPHLTAYEKAYLRAHPMGMVHRADPAGDLVDFEPPYDYFIRPWLFTFQNYDKHIEPWHCAVKVKSVELFTVDGEVYVDRLGPDIAPRVRFDAAHALPGGGAP